MKEKRFYLVSMNFHDNITEMSDEDFIKASEIDGTVYSEAGFIEDFNLNNVSPSTQFLRILEVEV